MSIDLRKLIKNGVHFGHQTSRWNPKMEPYIWGYKNEIHLIDVSKTAHQLERASKFLETVVGEGRTVLLVGTKKAAQESVGRISKELNLPFVMHRWVGGTFSNFRQVRKAIANMLHFEDILSKSEQFHYNKKELNTLKKRYMRLSNIVGGIRNLTWPVGAVIIIDVKKEHVCVKEAATMGIPVVGIVDTNSDPETIDYVIPGNDDAPRSINVLMDYLAEAIQRGQAIAASKPKDQLAVAESYEGGQDGFGFDNEEDEEKKRSAARRAKGRTAGGGGGGGARPKSSGSRPAPRGDAPVRAHGPAAAAAPKEVIHAEAEVAPIESPMSEAPATQAPATEEAA